MNYKGFQVYIAPPVKIKHYRLRRKRHRSKPNQVRCCYFKWVEAIEEGQVVQMDNRLVMNVRTYNELRKADEGGNDKPSHANPQYS